MIEIKKLDHVAFCVREMDAFSSLFRKLFSLQMSPPEFVSSQKTQAAFMATGECNIELISPQGNAGLEKFLEKRGQGLHHIAFEVEGIERALLSLKNMGAELIDEIPRIGARGHKVAFLHPKTTGGVLVELVEPQLTIH